MEFLLKFRRKDDMQNVLFDEFFLEASEVEIIAFNYDAKGSALCRCDGELQAIGFDRLHRIVFGVSMSRLDDYIRSIYDNRHHSEDLKKIAGNISFRLEELNELEKYSVQNLAKKIHKELLKVNKDNVRYFDEVSGTGKKKSKKKIEKKAELNLLHGNTSTKVFHKQGCVFYNDKNCTARFTDRKEAVSAGYKACKLCDK